MTEEQIARVAHASGAADELMKWRMKHDTALLPLEARDHPEPHTMLWSETEMRAIRDYAARCVAAALAGNGETFVAPCNGCQTPGRCKDTDGCASAGLRVPTYYVRHPDETYTQADPQPVLRA